MPLNLFFLPLLKVMEAEQTKTRSELVHKETAAKYNAAMGRMKQLEKKLKRAINKSKYDLRLERSSGESCLGEIPSLWLFLTCENVLLSVCSNLTAQLVLVFVLVVLNVF